MRKQHSSHLFMDMLTRLMMTLPSTRSAFAQRTGGCSHLKARMVGRPGQGLTNGGVHRGPGDGVQALDLPH